MTTTAIDFDVFDHAVQDDPLPVYRRLRDEAPLFRQEEFGYWVMSRHADVWAATRDDETFSNRMGVTLDASAWNEHAHLVMSFLAMDPPETTRLRRLVSQGFTPRRVRELAPTVERLTHRYLDDAIDKGEFDWITEVAGRIPMDVISEMMGVPESDRIEVRRLSDLLAYREDGLRDVPPVGMEAALTLHGYYADLIAEKKRKPGDDLTSALVGVEADGNRMTDREIAGFLFLMVVAGNETTTKLLGNAVFHLPDADQRSALDDSAMINPWVEETLRRDTSTQFIARLVIKDFTAHGVTVPAGSQLLLALGAANHDDRVFTDPGTFDLRRSADELAQILSFGGGRHFCLGANLARMEARIVLGALAQRVSDFRVDHDACVRFYSSNVRGFAHVPMAVTAR